VRGRRSLVAACFGLAFASTLTLGSLRALGSPLGSGSVEARFDPGSVTFVSTSTGWVLGTAPCASAGRCLALRETTDAGHAWTARPLPAALLVAADRRVGGGVDPLATLGVRFADLRDGWIYGGLAASASTAGSVEPTLWSTHDGGLVWRRQPLPGLGGGPIFDLEASHGRVYLMAPNRTTGVTVESSPVGRDSWRASDAGGLGDPAGGGQQSGAIVLQGATGWLVEGNDRGTTGSARLSGTGVWVRWTPPCASVGNGFAVPAASTPSNLVAVCVMGGFASALTSAAPRGATIGSSWLYRSTDGGSSFEAGRELGGQGTFFGGVLATPTHGVVLIGRGASDQELAASFDGGLRWTVVYRGRLVFLGFTSPTQGVGLVQSSTNSTTTSMIMTFDGGHRWEPVGF
jgi:hypothetical protein